MKKFLRNWLGINEILANIEASKEEMVDELRVLKKDRIRMEHLLAGLGRILAKVDPLFGISENDEKRKAESDELGKKVVDRLKAEQAVRDKYGYTP